MFELSETTFCYFKFTIKKLNLKNIQIDICKQNQFEIMLSYSFDGTNYSEFIPIDKCEDKIIDDSLPMYVCILFNRVINNDLGNPLNLYDIPVTEDKYYGNISKIFNVNSEPANITVEKISYNCQQIEDYNLNFKEMFDIINQFPKWNFYDNQQITIKRWLEQCNSIAEMYGHTVIYFKTEAVETELESQSGIHGIHHTLANNVIRNVVSIKRLHICIPNNEIPQDRVIYTDWDMPMIDDFIIHIVRQKFEQAFGLKSIPNEKDFIYFPLLNKLYRVSTMQPKNSFMGVVGWYEVYLTKYEQDDCVRIDNDLKNESYNMFEEITGGIDDIIPNVYDNEINEELKSEFDEMVSDEIISNEKINLETIEEKKSATENFTNKLEDTTHYVSLKETEKLREFYNKRLDIVIVNPDESLFPINMYNCKDAEKHSVALRYNLKDYSINNKFSNICKNNYTITFDFVITGRFTSEILDISYNNNSLLSVECKFNKLQLFDTSTQTIIGIDYKFDKNELYQISIEYNKKIGVYSYRIFKLENKQKLLIHQNINKLNNISNKDLKITNLNLYGGNYLISNVILIIDNHKLLEDKCEPLLNTYKF